MQPKLAFLIVDDDEVAVLSLRRALGKLNLVNPVEVARDGREALERLRARGDAPCIVLLDVNMPGMGGLEFLDVLASQGTAAKVAPFLLVSRDTPADLGAAHSDQIAGRVCKDSLPGSLKAALERLAPGVEIVSLPRPSSRRTTCPPS